jgi:hypothetical protein
MIDLETRAAALAEQHRRLRHLAQRVVDEARPAGTSRPLCTLEPSLVKAIRRELRGEPQPQSLDWFTMSPGS